MERKNIILSADESANTYGLDDTKNELNKLKDCFQADPYKDDLFSKIIEFFPYALEVFSKDGFAVMINNAVLRDFCIPSKDLIIGKYNIFEDSMIENYQFLDLVKQVFKGESVSLTNLKVQLFNIRDNYCLDNYSVNAIYQYITAFPIKDNDNKVIYVVIVFINRGTYKCKDSIINAIEYIKNNWYNKFNIDELADVANLSTFYFSRLFKKEIGITPYNYYMNVKIEKLKEMLSDNNLSVAEVFAACGMDYHGHFANVFKKMVGTTPSQYRKLLQNK